MMTPPVVAHATLAKIYPVKAMMTQALAKNSVLLRT